ncbi:MAG: hypothetical protein K0S01_3087 [Herbinix sp.]|jgi:glycosyltransferase involved in cell wall biosynthesis|nr:hypothetical protein [Herbinix sp.]
MKRVTVIMPVYNAEKYLKIAIDSILNQTYSNFELLLIDDASTDGSADIIKQYDDERIRLVRNKVNMGISGTRNKGLELCSTEYIALLDNDDIATPTRLEKEVQYLDENRDVDVVAGQYWKIDENGELTNKHTIIRTNPKYIKAYLMLGNTISNGTAMFRKSFINKFGIRYQNNYYGAEDYKFWVECSLHGKIVNLDEVFLLYRMGHNNETKRALEQESEERIKAISSIHTYALEKTGFKLREDEITIINKIFKEEGIINNKDELEQIYRALKSIAKQAMELQLDNAKEVITMCRKRYGDKVGKAFYMWE